MSKDSLDRDRVKDHLLAGERIQHEWMLSSLQKFRLFFAGLVFAILAFSVQFGITSRNDFVEIVQPLAWLLLLITGCLALRDAGGFVVAYTQDKFEGLKPNSRKAMWVLFVVAMFLLILVRSCSYTGPHF
jgi:hypothetical protein